MVVKKFILLLRVFFEPPVMLITMSVVAAVLLGYFLSHSVMPVVAAVLLGYFLSHPVMSVVTAVLLGYFLSHSVMPVVAAVLLFGDDDNHPRHIGCIDPACDILLITEGTCCSSHCFLILIIIIIIIIDNNIFECTINVKKLL